jgi:hypothetical protein
MQQIETAVGENDPLAAATPLGNAFTQLCTRNNFCLAITHAVVAEVY